MKDYLTIHKNMLGATTSGTSFNSSRRGSSSTGSHSSSGSSTSSSSSSSTKIDKTTTPPGAVGFHSSSGESWTIYYDRDGNKYNSLEEYQAEMKRQEEERKRQEEEQQRGHGSSVNRRETFAAHGIDNGNGNAPGGNYNFSLDDESVRNKINNSEDDNTLLYAILAGIGIVGVAFLAKKSKNKNKKKKR